MEKEEVKISVRDIVEFILRSGDIDNRRGGWADKESLAKGTRIHKKIQRQMGAAYQAEVPLSYRFCYEDLDILVEGRADGIEEKEDHVMVDEIKGVHRDLRYVEEPVLVHLAQAKCYAAIYTEQNQQEQMEVQMTYCNMETEEIRRFSYLFDAQELKNWFQKLADTYYVWAHRHQEWKKERDASMTGLEFPFPYREGQRDLVHGVYRTILREKQLFIQAPTGVGKTMSCLYPAVRSVGEGISQKIFYLTAKTITRTVAWEAFEILKKHGLRWKSLLLTAKEKLCVCENMECNPAACARAKGHFDRVNDAVYELWTTEEVYSREVIRAHAEKWQVCPFEMCLDLSIWVDGIICDYNYVFDPNVHLKRFFGVKYFPGIIFF